MQREKLVDELCVGDGRRIEDDLDRFAVAGLAGADLAVRRRVRLATCVADTRRTYAPEPLECGLRGPESAECEVCDFGVATGGRSSAESECSSWQICYVWCPYATGCWSFLSKLAAPCSSGVYTHAQLHSVVVGKRHTC